MNKVAKPTTNNATTYASMPKPKRPKFRKASKEEIEASVANYHAILERISKLEIDPTSPNTAVELIREMRDKD